MQPLQLRLQRWYVDSPCIFHKLANSSAQTQYYIAVSGQSALYIGTYITAEPTVGELRFIARLKADVVTSGVTAANVRGA